MGVSAFQIREIGAGAGPMTASESVAAAINEAVGVDSPTSGAISLLTGTTMLTPLAPATYTLAPGQDGQQKLILLTTGHACTITGLGAFSPSTAGDYCFAVYSAGIGSWVPLAKYIFD